MVDRWESYSAGGLIMGEHIFEQLAHERNITVEEMRAIISARIE